MALSNEQARERVKAPKNKNIIAKAIQHESRIRFHVDCALSPGEVSHPATVFLDWVKTLIPKDKYNIFVSLFKFPIPTVDLTETIFGELERVFDGRNPAMDYQFTDSLYKEDWEEYREEVLKEPHVWRIKGWEAVKTAINSVLIVDLPQDQTGSTPEPYFYFLKINNVLDFGYKGDKLEYIIFRQENDTIAVYDDERYRVYQLDSKGAITDTLVDEAHGLGYCPARFFWTDDVDSKNRGLKKSPVSNQLANLDWLLFFSISKRHLDLYAPYPIYSGYEANCDFENNETGDYCSGGYLRDKDDNYKIQGDGVIQPCPVCAEKRLSGAGSFIDVPAPDSKDDPDLRNPITITTVDKSSLDYNVEEKERLKNSIIQATVGLGENVQQKQSINEMQVTANFESRVSILNNLKGNLEAAQKFVDDTVCRLRYGDFFKGSSISYGTEFYIYSVEDLYKQYKQAKENGAAESQLGSISTQILSTEHRNNPTQLRRMLLLKQLEPYRHYTLDELIQLKSEGLADEELLRIKINFNTFVERFERENININEFGILLDLDKKIKIIIEKFKEYAKEQTRAVGRTVTD